MSSLIVEVCAIEEIAPHSNADKLERVRIKNWWCIALKGHYSVGDKVVYLPPDSIIPETLAEKWGITKYCSPLSRGIDGQRPPGLRIKANRFRGEPSFGCVQDIDDPSWSVGTDVKEYYNVQKWEPPVKCLDGDAAPPVHAFHTYTDIENIGNFPGIFQDGEEVIITEKIHGTNSRVGLVFHADSEAEGFTWQWMAGSHGTRRKEFNEKGFRSKYWFPFIIDETGTCPLHTMIRDIKTLENAKSAIIIFGEIFGIGIQDMQYGQKGLSFRIFDIAVDGKYLCWDALKGYVDAFPSLELVPILYRGPFSMKKVEELVDGPTTIASADQIIQAFKGREGIVIKPVIERFDESFGGRVIMKYISVDYHDRKNANRTEEH